MAGQCLFSLDGKYHNRSAFHQLPLMQHRQDLIACTTTEDPPVFPRIPCEPPSIVPESQISEHCCPNFSLPTFTLSIPTFAHSTGPYSAIPSIMYSIRHFTLIVESFRRTRGATDAEMLDFSCARNNLEYSLLAIPTPDIECFAIDSDQFICEVVRIVAIMYMNYVLLEFDPIFQVLQKLKRKLIAVIGAGEKGLDENATQNIDVIMLWALFMGGLVSLNADERTWFGSRIAILVEKLGLQTWDAIEHYLMKALWIRRMNNKACWDLWTTVLSSLNLKKVQM